MAIQELENRTLILDLVQWIAKKPRSYAEVMEAWRTSCPRFPVWEDAIRHGFLAREYEPGVGATVRVTRAGRALLSSNNRK